MSILSKGVFVLSRRGCWKLTRGDTDWLDLIGFPVRGRQRTWDNIDSEKVSFCRQLRTLTAAAVPISTWKAARSNWLTHCYTHGGTPVPPTNGLTHPRFNFFECAICEKADQRGKFEQYV